VFALIVSGANLFAQSWNLVWADEFTNGISGDWVFETGAGGWGNNELEYYRRENASVQNGQLVLTAKRESFGGANYTSVRMKTQGKKSWKYGKIEARIAVPSFQGAWPAFWMLGDNIGSVGWPACGEIDIMEHINTGNTEYGTIHWAGPSGSHAEYSGNTQTNGAITGYHTYAVEWDANAIKWFVDGVKFHEANIAGNVNSTEELHNNFFILLNFAIGGNWPGFGIDNNAFPANMYVDYVRVYQLGATPPPSGGVITTYKDCNYSGAAVSLPVGNYNLAALQSRGIANDDISSIRVNAGYEAVLFWDDNFSGSSLVVGGDNACLVNNGWNDQASSIIVRTKTTSSFSRTIEAESYSAMAGVQTEPCSEGGSNVGYIETGDWMAYNSINFPTSGNYKIEYRVASMNGGKLSTDLNAGSIVLGAVNIPATGGWQNWTTVSHTVYVNAGTYNLGVFAASGGWNINWLRISGGSGARTSAQPASSSSISTTDMTEEALELFPNPADAEINVATNAGVNGLQYMVVNAIGETVMSGTFSSEALAVNALNAGIYTLVVYKEDGSKVSKRFVKQ